METSKRNEAERSLCYAVDVSFDSKFTLLLRVSWWTRADIGGKC